MIIQNLKFQLFAFLITGTTCIRTNAKWPAVITFFLREKVISSILKD